MLHLLADYGLFFAKTITIVLAVFAIFAGIIVIASRGKIRDIISINNINEKFNVMQRTMEEEILSKKMLKENAKESKKLKKQQKNKKEKLKKRIYVIDFDGDIRASQVNQLREEVTAILTVATPKDEVLIRLESPGGLVHAYGLAASQLHRIKEHKIPLTVAVDKVAASGGYLMACVANKILCAPFAIIGSIGVLIQLPNFNRLLKKHHIDYEQITAGEHKRTLSLFGENTDKGREKIKEEIEETHQIFKDFIHQHRHKLDVDKIATGEHWLGSKAHELKLVDEITTSDNYLLTQNEKADIFLVEYISKKTLGDKLTNVFQRTLGQLHLFNLESK